MKKSFCLLFLMLLSFSSFSQGIPQYGIPSTTIPIYGPTLFSPTIHSAQTGNREKKKINTSIHGVPASNAMVIVYSLDGLNTMGPYTVNAGETLSVEIDDRDWGVAVNSDDDITVDVWISTEQTRMRREISPCLWDLS